MKVKGNKVLIFILIWTILSFLIDSYNFFTSETVEVNSKPFFIIIGLFFVIIELVIIWIIYQSIEGKKWSYVVLIIYYGFRSINIYTDSFSYYTHSGLGVELKSGNIGMNLIMIIFFITLLMMFSKRFKRTNLEESTK